MEVLMLNIKPYLSCQTPKTRCYRRFQSRKKRIWKKRETFLSDHKSIGGKKEIVVLETWIKAAEEMRKETIATVNLLPNLERRIFLKLLCLEEKKAWPLPWFIFIRNESILASFRADEKVFKDLNLCWSLGLKVTIEVLDFWARHGQKSFFSKDNMTRK